MIGIIVLFVIVMAVIVAVIVVGCLTDKTVRTDEPVATPKTEAKSEQAAPSPASRKEEEEEEDPEDGMWDYSIAGINYSGLQIDGLVRWRGCLMLDDHNEHDPNAVAIYAEGRRIGFIPREDAADVRAEMVKMDRCAIECHGYCNKTTDDDGEQYMFGGLMADWNK